MRGRVKRLAKYITATHCKTYLAIGIWEGTNWRRTGTLPAIFLHTIFCMKRETVDILKRLLYPEAPLVEKELPCHE
jgi:hypothetical protein